MFCQIRAGTDIAFLGGLINYAHRRTIAYAKEYLVNYTNAAFIVKDGFKLPEDGLFSGFDAADTKLRQVHLELRRGRKRDRHSRRGNRAGDGPASGTAKGSSHNANPAASGSAGPSRGQGIRRKGQSAAKGWRRPGPPATLPPNVAYDTVACSIRVASIQLLKKQYSRYTPEMVERITGIPKDQFLKAADMFTSIRKDGDMKKVGDHHLCGRLDAAHLRHPDHPHCCACCNC